MKPPRHLRRAHAVGAPRLRSMLDQLLLAGWTPQELFSPGRGGPGRQGRGLAWSEWWTDRRVVGVVLEPSGAVAFVIRERSGAEHRLRAWPLTRHPAYQQRQQGGS